MDKEPTSGATAKTEKTYTEEQVNEMLANVRNELAEQARKDGLEWQTKFDAKEKEYNDLWKRCVSLEMKAGFNKDPEPEEKTALEKILESANNKLK